MSGASTCCVHWMFLLLNFIYLLEFYCGYYVMDQRKRSLGIVYIVERRLHLEWHLQLVYLLAGNLQPTSHIGAWCRWRWKLGTVLELPARVLLDYKGDDCSTSHWSSDWCLFVLCRTKAGHNQLVYRTLFLSTDWNAGIRANKCNAISRDPCFFQSRNPEIENGCEFLTVFHCKVAR